mgnify:CR=1 FL=1
MNIRYPFDFPEADPVYANNELGPHGYYPAGANNFWHGGIHLTETRPVIAVADGTAVAYRITERNNSDRVQGRTVEYSNCFVLLKHEHITPRRQSISFYSLYMHLLPWGLYTDEHKRRPPVLFSAAGYEVTTREDAPRGLNIRSAADGSIVTVAPCGSVVEVDSSPTNMATQGYFPHARRRSGSHRKVFFTDHTGTRHTDCYALLDQTRARPENGTYRIITIEDPPTAEQRQALSGLRLRSAKNFDDSTIIRVMPRGTVIQAEPDDGKWYRVLDDNGETQGYTYNNNNLRQTTSLSVNPSPDVVTCEIPVKAGDILGFAGRYHGENILHLEIFTHDIGFMDNPKGDESRSSPVRIAAGASFKTLALPRRQAGRRFAAGTRLRLVTDMALLNSPPYNDAREVSAQGATWWVKKSEMDYDWDNPCYTLKQDLARVYASNPEIEIPIDDCDATLAEERVVQRADMETMEYEGEEWLGIPLDGAPGGRAWISGNDPAVTPVNYFNWNEFFTKMTDTGDGYCDVRKIIEKIEAVRGNEQDHLLHTREIRRAVREPTTARHLRSLVVQHPTEWSASTDQSINRWEALWKYPFGQRRQEVESEIVPHIQNLQWWDDAGLDELDPKTLWFFHPVRFLEHVGRIVGGGCLITQEQLKQIMKGISDEKAGKFAAAFSEMMPPFEIDTTTRQAHFLAQVAHETGNLRYLEEIGDGSAYENRTDLGNTQPGDGERFKGRGIIQLTGRKNYTLFQNYLRENVPEFRSVNITDGNNPKKVAEDFDLACCAGGWYWKYARGKKLLEACDRDDVFWVSVYVNGWARQKEEDRVYKDREKEPNNMKHRIECLKRAKRALGIQD